MVRLNDAEKLDLERAVVAAEKRTSVEIVLAVADMCDDYRAHTLPFAAATGFAVFGGLAALMPEIHVRTALLIVGAVTLVVAAVLQWPPLRLLTAPRAAKESAATRLAGQEFAALVAGRTAAGTGVLVFIALAEHYAEIVPEPALAVRVPQATWQGIMDTLTGALKAGRVVDGIKAAVIACGEAAAAAFPAGADERDELPNAPHTARPL